MKHIIENRHHKYSFDSLPELYRYLKDAPNTWRQDESHTARAQETWDLGVGFEGAMKLASTGWVEGARRIAKSMKSFKSPERGATERLSIAGYRPCVPAHLAGSPRSMFAKHNEGAPLKPVIRLVVQVGALYGVNAKHMANIGAAVAQYVKQQEAHGVRVEVYGASSASSAGNTVTFIWRVKKAEQPLDLPMLAFSIGHPAMQRRLVFALRERSSCPRMPSYGATDSISERTLINPIKNAKYINGMKEADIIAKTPADAWAWLERQTRED